MIELEVFDERGQPLTRAVTVAIRERAGTFEYQLMHLAHSWNFVRVRLQVEAIELGDWWLGSIMVTDANQNPLMTSARPVFFRHGDQADEHPTSVVALRVPILAPPSTNQKWPEIIGWKAWHVTIRGTGR